MLFILILSCINIYNCIFYLLEKSFNFLTCSAIRECLRYDPDHKACFAHYKNIKKIAGHLKAIQDFINQGNYAECITQAEKAIPLETKVPQIMYLLQSKLCICHNKVVIFIFCMIKIILQLLHFF